MGGGGAAVVGGGDAGELDDCGVGEAGAFAKRCGGCTAVRRNLHQDYAQGWTGGLQAARERERELRRKANKTRSRGAWAMAEGVSELCGSLRMHREGRRHLTS